MKAYTLEVSWWSDEVMHDILGVYTHKEEAQEYMKIDIEKSMASDHPEQIEYNEDNSSAHYSDGKRACDWWIREWNI